MTAFPGGSRRWLRVAAALAIVGVVGGADYLTGHEILFPTFYLGAVALAAWTVGRGFAALVSVLSVGAWLVGDSASGAVYSHPLVPLWNAAIVLAFYLIVVWLLDRLRGMHRQLEERVRQRTLALTEEMAERERLEREILEIGERERRRIGHDLHDTLGQHLTGAALAGQVLGEKLAARSLPEAKDAGTIVTLVEEAIELTRTLSSGLHPVELERGGLVEALRRLAASTSERLQVECRLQCDPPVTVDDATTAMHLYRIAQEAISNAVRHGRARRITIRLEGPRAGLRLAVTDDGVGIADPPLRGRGMGLRIMAHRAGMVGGTFTVRREAAGGTTVACLLETP